MTGGRRSGKSTLLAALAPRLGAAGALPGLTTWAQPGRAVYLKENITGRTAVIGRFDPALPGPAPKTACAR